MLAPLLLTLSISTAAIPDKLVMAPLGAVELGGYLGNRVNANANGRMRDVDENELLDGYRKRPGSHPWIGEHVGKFLDAATRAWGTTNDPVLRDKIDRVAAGLIATQEADGYLGTYTADKRFGLFQGADWDVWSHKYNLIGLQTYYQYRRKPEALEACRKMADLLIETFGPGKKTLLSAGTHMGMASTSVLEPIVTLYEETRDPRYLAFAKHIVSEYDLPGGPGVVKSLLDDGKVAKTANGKAYEMLSNLVGLCRLSRVTGDSSYGKAAERAWSDVRATQLYITGTASHGEHFGADHDLPNMMSANIGETCVTVTWIQLNLQLLQMTGDRKYADEIERSAYNHLSGAQLANGKQWCYYTPLDGTKPFGNSINCCLSSGPRGMSLMPQAAFLTYLGGVAINTMESASFQSRDFVLSQKSSFPTLGKSTVTFRSYKQIQRGLMFRVPAWAGPMSVQIGKARFVGKPGTWLTVPPRTWKGTTVFTLKYDIKPKLVAGAHGNAGYGAGTYGPFVLAYDSNINRGSSVRRASISSTARLIATSNPLTFVQEGREKLVKWTPFADVGPNSNFRIWMPYTETLKKMNPQFADEFFSRQGNVAGSIVDGNPSTFVVTYNNQRAEEDTYRVVYDKPVRADRVIFYHGRVFHDGGWFDTSTAPVSLTIKTDRPGEVLTFAVSSYPKTTATDPAGLRDGSAFITVLPNAVTIKEITLKGRPAHGDRPEQSFSSCGEISIGLANKTR